MPVPFSASEYTMTASISFFYTMLETEPFAWINQFRLANIHVSSSKWMLELSSQWYLGFFADKLWMGAWVQLFMYVEHTVKDWALE